MPFEYILADLLARNEDAVGTLFVDESGEAVDMAYTDLTPYQLKVVGAYLSIYLRQVERLSEEADLGTPHQMHIAKNGMHIYAVALPEGYCLAMVQRRPALVAKAQRSLEDAAQLVRKELFD
jgi:predicted regulator of Ras-like GTPase activity (Roadblock/LC7/MglB family)